jgi:RNA polymerase sigma factor (sigma-70 family)
MIEKQQDDAHAPLAWDKNQVRLALASARALARRFARQRRLSSADREDLVQDILLAIVEASPRFDAARGSWATFVAVLARRAIINRARQSRLPPHVSLDAEEGRSARRTLCADLADVDARLALLSATAGLPTGSRQLLREILAHGDVVDAREAHAASAAGFYRQLQDLRFWLHALGARPPRMSCAVRSKRPPSGA